MCKSNLAISLFPVLNQMLSHKLKIFKKRSRMIRDLICKCPLYIVSKDNPVGLKKQLYSLVCASVLMLRRITDFCAFILWHF